MHFIVQLFLFIKSWIQTLAMNMHILKLLLPVIYLSEGTLFLVKIKQKHELEIKHTKDASETENHCRDPVQNDTNKMM